MDASRAEVVAATVSLEDLYRGGLKTTELRVFRYRFLGVLTVSGLDEDGGRVVGNHVDATKLLSEHDNPGRQCRSAVARDSEQFDELSEQVLALVGLAFQLHPYMSIVGIPCCLHVREPKTLERSERLIGMAMLNVPPGRKFQLRASFLEALLTWGSPGRNRLERRRSVGGRLCYQA